jgi:hypothetical protein
MILHRRCAFQRECTHKESDCRRCPWLGSLNLGAAFAVKCYCLAFSGIVVLLVVSWVILHYSGCI